MPKFVRKNSGHIQRFSTAKLKRSIACALRHCGEPGGAVAEQLAHESKEYLEGKGLETAPAEEIRRAVLHVMREDGKREAANAYELTSLHLPELKIGKVIKRGGGEETFHPVKLFKSIRKSLAQSGMDDGKLAEEVTKETVARLELEHVGKPLSSRAIMMATARALAEKGLKNAEKAYLLNKYA